MPANYVQDKSGNKAADPVQITFTVMNRPTVEKGAYDKVVTTTDELVEAINAANSRSDKTTRYRIFLKKGTYQLPQSTTETFKAEDANQTTIQSPITYIKASNISFIGEDRDATIITNTIGDETYTNSLGQTVSIYERIGYSDVLQIQGGVSGTYFQDVTIKSGIADNRGRNISLNDRGTKTILKNTSLWAYQDTYVSNNSQGLYYFEDGVIRGRTDFICGSGDAFFNKVEVIMCENGGYVVAPRDNQKYGYVFKDCSITGQSSVDGTYYLGRAWTAAAETYFIDTKMEVKPATAGWHDWNNGPTRFAEYHSTNANGVVIDLNGRATTINGSPNNPELSDEEAAEIGNLANTFGDWQPTLATEQAPVPSNVQVSGNTLTWDNSDYALLWAVCKDGDIIDFTTEPTYTVTDDGQYSIRAANEMGGLSTSSTAVTVNATGIDTISSSDAIQAAAIYSIDGKRLQQLQHGLNIIKMSDGTTRKVMMK